MTGPSPMAWRLNRSFSSRGGRSSSWTVSSVQSIIIASLGRFLPQYAVAPASPVSSWEEERSVTWYFRSFLCRDRKEASSISMKELRRQSRPWAIRRVPCSNSGLVEGTPRRPTLKPISRASSALDAPASNRMYSPPAGRGSRFSHQPGTAPAKAVTGPCSPSKR